MPQHPGGMHGAITRLKSQGHLQGRRKIAKVLGEFKRGSLKSSSGSTVRSRKQAVAIALSEAKRRRKKAS